MVKKSDKVKLSPLVILAFVVLIIYCLCILSPIFWGLLTSVKHIDDFRNNVLGFPRKEFGFAFENYSFVLERFHTA